MKPQINCNQIECLNNEECKCSEFIPTIVSKLIPNETDCPYFENEEINKSLKFQKLNKQPEQTTEKQSKEIEKLKKKIKKKIKKEKKEPSKNQLKNKIKFY